MHKHSASLLLLLLLSADFVSIVLHIIIMASPRADSLCDISGLCEYSNFYHLVKLFWIIILFAYALISTRSGGYISWILVFTFFLFDDALLLHQKIGDQVARVLAAYLPHTLSLQTRFWELAVLAMAGVFLLAGVAWAYTRSSPLFRKISIDVLLFILALVFFGAIVDLGTVIKLGPELMWGLHIIEDGGETVVISLILWCVFVLAAENGRPDRFLHDRLCKPRHGAAPDS